jgi:hypothetical protein
MRKVIDIEGVIGSRQSKKDPQYNDQEKKIVEKTHIDLQGTTQKQLFFFLGHCIVGPFSIDDFRLHLRYQLLFSLKDESMWCIY